MAVGRAKAERVGPKAALVQEAELLEGRVLRDVLEYSARVESV